MFEIKFLPARFGDSIWIEYGNDGGDRHRILIDGGTGGTRRDIQSELRALPADQRHLELLVVSHIDRDHIEGIIGLLEDNDPAFTIGDFWFNGWPHLPDNDPDEPFGAVQAERLTQLLVEGNIPWNSDPLFDGGAVRVPDAGDLPEITLPGGMKLTLLTPSDAALAELKPVWEAEVREANLDPGFALPPNDDPDDDDDDESFGDDDPPDIDTLAETPFEDDDSEANGSSISFLAEFDGKRVLFAADAHVGKLLEALERVSPNERLALDLFKISHHGSKRTTSKELIEKVECSTYVFSTNGSLFKHPHAEAVSRVIKAGGADPELVFNYKKERNEVWGLDLLETQHGYTTRYPADGEEGIAIAL